jgi:hypothetical protein
VRSGAAVQRLALEFDALAADVYWIRAIQHYGGDRLARQRGRSTSCCIRCSISPPRSIRSFTSRRFGAIFLSEAYPGGPGSPKMPGGSSEGNRGRAEQVADLLRPRLRVYWHDRTSRARRNGFKKRPSSPTPNWLPPLVGSMLTAGEERKAARTVWGQILQSDQEWLRRTAERNLLQLDALRRSISFTPLPAGFRLPQARPIRGRV